MYISRPNLKEKFSNNIFLHTIKCSAIKRLKTIHRLMYIMQKFAAKI